MSSALKMIRDCAYGSYRQLQGLSLAAELRRECPDGCSDEEVLSSLLKHSLLFPCVIYMLPLLSVHSPRRILPDLMRSPNARAQRVSDGRHVWRRLASLRSCTQVQCCCCRAGDVRFACDCSCLSLALRRCVLFFVTLVLSCLWRASNGRLSSTYPAFPALGR